MQIDYQKLAQAMLKEAAAGVTTKTAVSGTPTASWGHGPTGLYSYPGMSKPVFSAMSLPKIGLQSMLTSKPNMELNPFYGIFTGVTASSGSEPSGVCDDPPVAGLSKLCTHTFVYGRASRMTRVFDILRSGKLTNRGEFTDLQFYGNPANMGNRNPNAPTGPSAASNMLNNEIAKALYEFAIAWQRDFVYDLYEGNPANNVGEGRKYYYGLDTLINTGYRDAITGQACAAADSIVFNFGSQDISNGYADTIVRRIANIYRRLRYIANSTGLDPVKWALTMPWGLFYELTAVWPCAYETYRCSVTGENNRANTDRRYMNEMTDSMRGNQDDRTGQYLLIDGQKVEVVIDDAVRETVLAGESFTASMYFVPLTVLGGTPVTYMEHINYDAPGGAMDLARAIAPGVAYETSDSGRFIWHKKYPNNFCVQMLATTEPRLILLTPQLAARITNIKYTPLAHERSWDTNSSFYVNGGRTDLPTQYGPSFYSPTA